MSTRYPYKPKDIFVAHESSFGVLPTPTEFQQVQGLGGSLEHSGEMSVIQPEYTRADMKKDSSLAGNKSAKFKLSLPLRGGANSPAAGFRAEINPELEAFFKACAEVNKAYSLQAQTSGSDLNTVAYAGSNDPYPGEIVAINPDGGSDLYYRQIRSVDGAGKTFDLFSALPLTATDSGTVFAGVNIAPALSQTDSAAATVNTPAIGGRAIVDSYTGLMGNVVVSGAIGADKEALMQATFSLKGDCFTHEDTASPTVSFTNGASAIVSNANPIQYISSTLLLNDEELAHAIFELDFGLLYSENPDGARVNGRSVWVLTERNPSIKTRLPDDPSKTFDPMSLFISRTSFPLFLHAGTYPNSMAVAVPKCEIADTPKEVELNGAKWWELTITPLRPDESEMIEFTLTLFGDQN